VLGFELRTAIAERYPDVSPDQVLVTNGTQQALNILACWAREEGRPVACETPTFTGVPGSFQIVGHSVESIPWGETPSGRALLYLCPDFHNPTGQTLKEEARRSIADWAVRNDGLVISDEIFRDLRFMGEAPPSLYSLLPAGRRVLVGSLSKTFMTGLRAGFLIADRPLLQDLLSFKRYMDLGGPALTQAIAAAFLRDGYDQHLKRMHEYYRMRRETVLRALQAMPDGVTWTKPEGGFHLWVTMPHGLSSLQLYLSALEHGVAISPGPAHDIDGRFLHCFRIGYGHLTPDLLKEALRRLVDTVKILVKQGRVETTTGIHV
jgi:DNA-binding transcriptional MocR family regulator